MTTLKSKIEQLKKDYDDRQKQINEILANTNAMMIAHAEGMKAMKEAMNELEKGLTHLNKDYKEISTYIGRLKNNRWIRWFGIK